ncbi:Uncharacterized protein TCM_028809 [Theobroma cacao]|uniref:Uncharacterized protein n=1 Tax=Theobroma cacao TaxID=3641 RepID=A0A061GAE1_THECC|nr:Uncharacterized protein TCM_028809 [Theobroma cacao]
MKMVVSRNGGFVLPVISVHSVMMPSVKASSDDDYVLCRLLRQWGVTMMICCLSRGRAKAARCAQNVEPNDVPTGDDYKEGRNDHSMGRDVTVEDLIARLQSLAHEFTKFSSRGEYS